MSQVRGGDHCTCANGHLFVGQRHYGVMLAELSRLTASRRRLRVDRGPNSATFAAIFDHLYSDTY